MENVLTLRTANGNTVEARIICRSLTGRLALHETTEGNKEPGEKRTYTLCHIGTTFAIATGIMRREDAERLLDSLDRAYDWDFRSPFSRKVYEKGKDPQFVGMLNSVRRYGGRNTEGHAMTQHEWRRKMRERMMAEWK